MTSSTDWRRWASSAPGHFVGNALLGQTCVWPARYFFEELSKKICDGSCGTRQLGWRILDLGLWRQGSCPLDDRTIHASARSGVGRCTRTPAITNTTPRTSFALGSWARTTAPMTVAVPHPDRGQAAQREIWSCHDVHWGRHGRSRKSFTEQRTATTEVEDCANKPATKVVVFQRLSVG